MPVLWTIRNETLQALDRGTRDRFVRALLADLKSEFPHEAERLGERRFRVAVENGVAAAGELKIEAEADVAEFLQLWMKSEQDVEGRWPWAEQILRNPSLTARARLELIRQMLA